MIMMLSNQASYHVGAAHPFISKILLFSAFSQLSQNLYNKVTCISFQSYKTYDWIDLFWQWIKLFSKTTLIFVMICHFVGVSFLSNMNTLCAAYMFCMPKPRECCAWMTSIQFYTFCLSVLTSCFLVYYLFYSLKEQQR